MEPHFRAAAGWFLGRLHAGASSARGRSGHVHSVTGLHTGSTGLAHPEPRSSHGQPSPGPDCRSSLLAGRDAHCQGQKLSSRPQQTRARASPGSKAACVKPDFGGLGRSEATLCGQQDPCSRPLTRARLAQAHSGPLGSLATPPSQPPGRAAAAPALTPPSSARRRASPRPSRGAQAQAE